mgnify:CR=1 FL=1
MNEWILVGIIVVGSVLALGGGTWIMSAISRRNKPPQA